MAGYPGETFLQHIRGAYTWIAQEFEHLYSQLQGYLSAEHKDDGRHSTVTADKLSITSADWFIRLFNPAIAPKLLEWANDKDGATPGVKVDMDGAKFLRLRFPYSTLGVSDVTMMDLSSDAALSGRGARYTGLVLGATTPAGSVRWAIGPHLGAGSSTKDALAVYESVPGNLVNTKLVAAVVKDPAIAGGTGKYLVAPDANFSTIAPVHLGHREFANGRCLWESVEGKMLYGLNGVQERGRTPAMGEWVSWTPTWNATITNPSLGGGGIVGRYTLIGKTCHFTLRLGMASSTTFGSGAYFFSFPIASSVILPRQAMGTAVMYDDNVGQNHIGTVVFFGTGSFLIACDQKGYMDAVNPFTWADNDTMSLVGTFEIA